MKGFLTGLSKLVLGVSLAFVLLSLTGVATARYFMAKLSVLPPRPVFDNDAVSAQPSPSASSDAAPQPEAAPATNEQPAPVEPEKPPGSYSAVVVQPIGLVLRAGPSAEDAQLGGVDYEDEVLVLQTSEDGGWLNVRIGETGQEGWIKAGNTQAVGE
jgi:hypothetical protein